MGSDFLEKDKIAFTENDLKDGDVVTLRNGARLIFIDGNFFDTRDSKFSNLLEYSCELTDDLRYKGTCSTNDIQAENDIMIVERPDSYTTIWHREEVKEMTLAQVCEELGYKVKIIKEE